MNEFFPTCQDVFLTLPAGAETARAANGEVLAIIAATSAFELGFDSGTLQYADAGFTYRGNADGGVRPRFAQLRFRNPNAFPIDIRVQVSNGEIFDNRAIFGAGSVPVVFAPSQVYLPREDVAVTVSNTANLTCAANAVTQISAATAARRRYVLQHLGTETMYIKTANTNNDNGIPICPGERLEIEARGALNIRNPVAFTQEIRRAEVTW